MQNQFSYQLVLMSLAISTFVIGSTEFITVGLLPLISSDLGISIPLAGLTVSIYALGVTIGGPIITSLFSHFPKKKLVLGILSILILGNLLSGLSGSFTTLLLSRIVTSFSHGIFMAVGTVIATDIVPENKKASSIAIMFSGLTISTIIGVPLGTFIGDSFGWRITFFFITGIGILALLLNTLFFPSSLPSEKKLQLSSIKGVLASKKTLGALLITVLGYGATFVPFAYLSPILKEFGGFSSSTISWILMGYGIMIALGNIIGGKLSNSKPIQSLFWMFIANAILLLVFYFTMLSYSPFFYYW